MRWTFSVLLCVALLVTASSRAVADIVTDWNVTLLSASVQASSPVQSRALAILHAAMHDAVNAVERKYTSHLVNTQAAGASIDVAAAMAAHGVAVWLFPLQKAVLDEALASSLNRVAEGPDKTIGMTVGSEIAQRYIAARGTDGADGKDAHISSPGPGQWQPTPPADAPMVFPHWAGVTPFVLKSVSEVTVIGPPAPTSPEFARDLNEVRAVGARDSAVRTADQTAAAIFWVVNTPVAWNAAARAVVTQSGLSLHDSARLFALMNMAGADAYIAAWAIKRRINHWRPVTAIRNAGMAQNAELQADPQWEPLLDTPAHPDYPSAHCIYSGAAERVLRVFFPDDSVTVSVAFPAVNGVRRNYRSFSQMAREVEGARVWAGIHFRTADEHGTAQGYQIADLALKNHLLPIGTP
jgi:PAP2 superfamily